MNPGQQYFLHNINFTGYVSPAPQPMMYKSAGINSVSSSNAASNISVGNKLKVTATVVLAAAPSADVTKIVHA